MGFWHMVLVLLLLTAAISAFDRKPDCPELEKCGKVSIPYPFGIKEGCSRQKFGLVCNDTHYSPPKPFLANFEVLEITLQGQMIVTTRVASDCYNESGRVYRRSFWKSLKKDGPFTFSNTRNKFTAIGCDTQVYITSTSGRNFTSGCMSFCWDKESVIDGICSGIGCCQTPIPAGARQFFIGVKSPDNHSSVLQFNPCSYAFLIADDHFKFNISDLSVGSQYSSYQGNDKAVPLVLDWAIGNETCQQAKENSSAYACKSLNSICYESTNGTGYLCNCTEGYEGNPYLEKGCTDTNECERSPNPCGARKCKNKEGDYHCVPNIQLIVVILELVIHSGSPAQTFIMDEGGVDQLVAVAELVKRCLKVKGEERPSMKEVAMELEGLGRAVEHPWVQKNLEETQSLLGETSEGYNGNGSVIGQDSLTNHTMSALNQTGDPLSSAL